MSQQHTTHTTSGYERDVRKLIRRNPELLDRIEAMVEILTQDPYNISRQHDIKKLAGVARGEGQWRIASGSYRIRYDIEGEEVILYSCKHRREAYR